MKICIYIERDRQIDKAILFEKQSINLSIRKEIKVKSGQNSLPFAYWLENIKNINYNVFTVSYILEFYSLQKEIILKIAMSLNLKHIAISQKDLQVKFHSKNHYHIMLQEIYYNSEIFDVKMGSWKSIY